jgi:hypothetical protein
MMWTPCGEDAMHASGYLLVRIEGQWYLLESALDLATPIDLADAGAWVVKIEEYRKRCDYVAICESRVAQYTYEREVAQDLAEQEQERDAAHGVLGCAFQSKQIRKGAVYDVA